MDATTVKYELTKRHTNKQTDTNLQKSYVEGPVQNEKTKIENVVWITTTVPFRTKD